MTRLTSNRARFILLASTGPIVFSGMSGIIIKENIVSPACCCLSLGQGDQAQATVKEIR
jgi:hypothetical protein